MSKEMIQLETKVAAPLAEVWKSWVSPEHIVNWNFASDKWCCPRVTNDLKVNGSFNWRMEAKDGSMGFDFEGTYIEIIPMSSITYTMRDGRKVDVRFTQESDDVRLVERFVAEGTNSDEMQRQGWQAILYNFKKYTESL